jgi:CRISPR-associated endonuclease Csn1
MSNIILGLDLGVTSIGYALFDEENEKILDTGVRIFQAGVDSTPLGKESPRNTTRREKRQVRRQIFRRAERQALLIEVLQDLGWLPREEVLLDIVLQKNPYELRKRALDEALSLEELARIFVHLSKRRGFKSSRKSGSDEDSEKGKLYKGDDKAGKKGISETQEERKNGGFRTNGEYFASLNPHELRIRNRYILRSDYLEEFDAIWQSQLRFHPEIEKPTTFESVVRTHSKPRQQERWKNKTLYDFLRDYVIYFQRPLKSQKETIGKCTLEPKSSRSPKSALVFQEYRIWDKLNSIRIIGPDRTLDPLTFEEKQKAYQKLSLSKEQTILQLMKLWRLGDGYSNNYDEKTIVKGNVTAHALIGVFGLGAWNALTSEEKEKRWKVVYDAEDNEWLKNYGLQKWNLSEEQAVKLTKVSFEKMYAELSQKAMSKILPFMKEQNLDYSRACVEAGYNHSQISETGRIADVLSPFNKKINSPIVAQGLHELRKLVNTLIVDFAMKPDVIKVELARELKMPKEKREAILIRNSANEKENKAIRDELFFNYQGFSQKYKSVYDIPTDDITKYKLWIECNKICPYTGKQISVTDLFGENNRFEIEHILPRSRSFDDSFQNKTLCEQQFNKDVKGNLMPYEMKEQGKISPEHYEQILERVKELKRNGRRNVSKIKKFTLTKIPDDMIARQLNETQFLAVAAKDYLKEICSNVQPTVGASTSQLRKLWGLNNVLNPVADVKNRDDHRHHAVDAIVVACTTIPHLQKLTEYNKKRKYGTEKIYVAPPYPTFRNDVKDAVEGILISHKVKNRPRGQMHDETMAGKVMNADKSHKTKVGDASQKFYTTRIALTDLIAAPAKVMKIGDKVVRDTVLQRLQEKGVNIHEKITKIPNDAFNETVWMPNKQGKNIHPIKHVRIHDVAANKIEIRKDTFVDGGNNHHILIFQKPNGKREGKIVSMYEVMALRKKNKLPAINTEVGEGNEFIMTLSTNEMVLVDNDNFKTADIDWTNPDYDELSKHLYRVQIITDGKVTFRHHLTSVLKDKEGNEIGRLMKTPNSFQGIKVKINHIGQISRA